MVLGCCQDWIERFAELRLGLALAVGEQQLEPWHCRAEQNLSLSPQPYGNAPGSIGVLTKRAASVFCRTGTSLFKGQGIKAFVLEKPYWLAGTGKLIHGTVWCCSFEDCPQLT